MKLSIITVNLNNCSGLEKTMNSVFSQSRDDFEYIVIDGGSTDGSLGLIKSHSEKISFWLSEGDKGIYNAMNKGIIASTGDYVLFLNSGDSLIERDTLTNAFSYFQGEDLIYGNLLFLDRSSSWIKTFPDDLAFEYFIHNYLPHPATFIKKSLFSSVGMYNESYQFVSDWEFFLLAINKYNCSYRHIPITISNFNLDGVSSNEENFGFIRGEMDHSLNRNFPTIIPGYIELNKLRTDFNVLQHEYNILKNSKFNKLNQRIQKILFG